ncbi:uracil-DNA glycosylase family protein [Nocardioides pelophilus]|uniref:uracil-DNA glycosylase family protein n=1 Tax=Nocardioides pelophilus TaxID=2172019 RepID=UPI00160058E6|nr:uracil-DNA glycosylase family protein [Nocardioides pelophilus]
MTDLGTFPFGAPVQHCGDRQPDPCDAFVLGAYPSAIHVRWVPPRSSGLGPVSALAVDNEPAVFWDGSDADERVKTWEDQYFDPAWGKVSTARLNGPSGAWLSSNILDPLTAAGAGSHFVTDCLTTYRLSTGAAARLNDTYEPMAKKTSGLRNADLKPHPGEAQIVREALESQRERLNRQIAAARPRVIVTLGNAASRVIASFAGAAVSGKLTQDGYGRPSIVTLAGIELSWIALVHPATPTVWQRRHQAWLSGQGFTF